MDKVTTLDRILSLIKNGDKVMVGGFASFGRPNRILNGLVATDVKNLTLISNCTSLPNTPLGELIRQKKFDKVIVSHIGTNPNTQLLVFKGEIELELVPQGTLVERIRCGGYGIGGFLTKTGLGTEIEEGKTKFSNDGEEYLLETALTADVTIIKCAKADRLGNLVFHGTAFSHSLQMATAGTITIVEADEIVETGSLDPDHIHTQSIFVDYILEG